MTNAVFIARINQVYGHLSYQKRLKIVRRNFYLTRPKGQKNKSSMETRKVNADDLLNHSQLGERGISVGDDQDFNEDGFPIFTESTAHEDKADADEDKADADRMDEDIAGKAVDTEDSSASGSEGTSTATTGETSTSGSEQQASDKTEDAGEGAE
jgi:hypothetical protein